MVKHEWQELLDFWFAESSRKRWFRSTADFDREIGQRFGELWQQAREGRLDQWQKDPQGALALVILLDQFPLNMFRDQPLSFDTEARSREVADQALARQFERQLSKEQLAFLLLPFMHSESMPDQERCVKLHQDFGLDDTWALHHRAIIERFGRFPHRNRILGRNSSEEEIAWLASDEGFGG